MAEQQHATLAKHVQSDTRAINEQPVELDGSAVITPEDVMKRRNAKEVEQATENRDEILAQRKKDPSVIVDVPGGLTAEEVKAVENVVG